MIKTINGEPFFVSVTYAGRFSVTSYWRPEEYKEMLESELKALQNNMEYYKRRKPFIVTAANIKPMTPAQRKLCRARRDAFLEALRRNFEPKPEPKLMCDVTTRWLRRCGLDPEKMKKLGVYTGVTPKNSCHEKLQHLRPHSLLQHEQGRPLCQLRAGTRR